MNVDEFLQLQADAPAQLTVGAVREICTQIAQLRTQVSDLETQVENLSDKVWDRDPMDE